MAPIFQTPQRLAKQFKPLPIFMVETASHQRNSIDYQTEQLKNISSLFSFKTFQPQDDPSTGTVLINEGPLFLQYYKSSDSFLFMNRNLISPECMLKPVLNPQKAKSKAMEIIKNQGLVYSGDNQSFQMYYAGEGYTLAQQAEILDKETGEIEIKSESEPVATEIRTHFGYMLNGIPVFGPGAKTILSFVGNELSEQVHFWRKPAEIIAEHELITPDSAIQSLLKKDFFADVIRQNRKNPYESNGRFDDNVEIGYYATPPFLTQQYYIPVYKIKGIFESKCKMEGIEFSQVISQNQTFRYNFSYYVSALAELPVSLNLKEFNAHIVI